MYLETRHIEDWTEFIEENNIDLSCPVCKGEGTTENGEYCEDCSGTGYIEPMWNTIWNSGFHAGDKYPATKEDGNVFAFDYDDEVWLGLSCCGMDCTPYLAKAWMIMFPDCMWIPEQFCVRGCNLTHGYIVSCVGKSWARKIYKTMRVVYRQQIQDGRSALRELTIANKRLKE